MANTYKLIQSITVGSGGAASIDFTEIPQTYTDLCLKVSLRADGSNRTGLITINNDTTDANYNMKSIIGSGSGSSSGGGNNRFSHWLGWPSNTESTFSNSEFYFPNYTASNYKSFSVDSVEENNATTAYQYLVAGLWTNTASINRLTITAFSGSFVQHSTAYLYGISNA
jgi:hypothetical protein